MPTRRRNKNHPFLKPLSAQCTTDELTARRRRKEIICSSMGASGISSTISGVPTCNALRGDTIHQQRLEAFHDRGPKGIFRIYLSSRYFWSTLFLQEPLSCTPVNKREIIRD